LAHRYSSTATTAAAHTTATATAAAATAATTKDTTSRQTTNISNPSFVASTVTTPPQGFVECPSNHDFGRFHSLQRLLVGGWVRDVGGLVAENINKKNSKLKKSKLKRCSCFHN
jgi:hypothetical protein